MSLEAPVPALRVRGLEKVFGARGALTHALHDVSFDMAPGEFTAIMGPSGSGKTTLLNCVSTLERPTAGSVMINGVDISAFSRRRLASFRREELGFIFQESNLIETLTGFENIALALTVAGTRAADITPAVQSLAQRLGIEDDLHRFPAEMSGGQRQRVATARALITSPRLVLADEPTGALDSHAASRLLELLDELNTTLGATILMVTHDAYAASYSQRVLFLRDGTLFSEVRRGDSPRHEHYQHILDVQAFLTGQADVR